jgi:DNA-binding Lrp family transcriptional regulator
LELEEVDFRILAELEADSKQSLKALSKNLGVPMSTVYDKIKRFEKNGVIKRYSAILDPMKVGRPTLALVMVSMRFQFSGEPVVNQKEVALKIARMPLVQEVYIISGEWDLAVKVRARDLKEIGDLIIERLRAIRGVDKTATLLVLDNVKDIVAFPHGPE